LFIEQLPEATHAVRQILQPQNTDHPGAVAKMQQAAQELEKAAADAEGPNQTRLFISVIVGAIVWIGFWLLGLREAGIWGLVAAVLFAVPYVGPAVVTCGAAVAGFVQFGSLSMAAAGGLSLTIAVIEGNVLTPWLMSHTSRMNAVAVFVSLLFWGGFGASGACCWPCPSWSR